MIRPRFDFLLKIRMHVDVLKGSLSADLTISAGDEQHAQAEGQKHTFRLHDGSASVGRNSPLAA